MQYNTQKNKVEMPEYGRGLEEMVELAVTLPTKKERQRCANTIVNIMRRIQPEVATQEDYTHRLWNHLARISHYKLDVDYPVDIVSEEEVLAHPEPLKYPMKRIKRRHYGYLVEEALDYARTLPEGNERNVLLRGIANQMKQNLFVWNKDSMDECLVAQDIERYTGGELSLGHMKGFRFAAVGIPTPQQLAGYNTKRKKKR